MSKTYEQWFDSFVAICETKSGLHPHDFPDWDFATAYENGDTPRQAFNQFALDMFGEYATEHLV